MSSLHQHTYFMHAVMCDTKRSLEDIFADLNDHEERNHKNDVTCAHRVYFNSIISRRLINPNDPEDRIKFMQLQPGDLHNSAAGLEHRGEKWFLPKWTNGDVIQATSRAMSGDCFCKLYICSSTKSQGRVDRHSLLT
jgi:hypothetical protein